MKHIEYCNKHDVNDPKFDTKKHNPKQVSYSRNLIVKLKTSKTSFTNYLINYLYQ